MPQASNELQDEIERLFGDPIDDGGPINFLEKAGFFLTTEWEWRPPQGVNEWDDLTRDQQICIHFLCDEWDFGGVSWNG